MIRHHLVTHSRLHGGQVGQLANHTADTAQTLLLPLDLLASALIEYASLFKEALYSPKLSALTK